MRRWNGWGEETTTYPLPDSAARYLERQVGKGCPAPDAPLAQVLRSIPASTCPAHSLITVDPAERLRHARGQSLPDWIALRANRIGVFPDAVSYPTTDEEVRRLMEFAKLHGIHLIPYGGGTSVVGHINPLAGKEPNLTVDLSHLNHPPEIDEINRLATFPAGICGPDLERALNRRGYTLGHFPQSFELSTLGGWVATRSSGQQSYYYGRIEEMFAGGHVETPIGPLDLPAFPASAAGPDLCQMISGSEGRLGILTRITVRIHPLPEIDRFVGVFFPDWQSGMAAVRAIAQAKVPVSMMRLSDSQETETTLALSGKENLVDWAGRALSMLGYASERCLLVLGITGERRAADQAGRQAARIICEHRGLPTGTLIGKTWRKSRFLTPYLRNTLWEQGYALDTIETALPWSEILEGAKMVKNVIRLGLDQVGEIVLVFAHLSHVYCDGASLYVTYLFRRAIDPEETLSRWQTIKSAASQVILSRGGTISHQHGIGYDHAPYLAAEKGQVGLAILEAARQAVDPDGLLNPGKLLD